MSDNPSGARILGTALARIQIQLAGVESARARLIEAAKSMREALKDAGKGGEELGKKGADGARKVGDAAKDSTKEVMSLKDALNNVRNAALAVSVVAAGITFKGVQGAKDLKLVNDQLKAVTGSVEGAQKALAEVQAFGKEFGQPLLPLQENAASIVRLSRTMNLSLRDTLLLVQKLVAFDPAQGFEGALFALREMASGDMISLNDRFEIGRSVTNPIKELVKSGDMQAAAKLLSDFTAQQGITTESMIEMGKSSAGAFGRVRDAVSRAVSTGFAPLFEILARLADGFANFINHLNESNPQLLQIGAVFVAATAAIGPLIVALGALTTAYATLKTVAKGVDLVGNLKAAGVMAGKAAFLGGAVVAGGVIGQTVATGLADRGIGDPRLRSGSKEAFFDVIGERLKQVLVIVVDGLIGFGETLAKVALLVANAIGQFLNIFRLAGAGLGILFGNLQKAIGELMVGIAGVLAKVGVNTGGLAGAGGKLQEQALWKIGESEREAANVAKELTRGFAPKPEDIAAVEATFRDLRSRVVGGLTDMLFPAQEVIQDAVNEVAQEVAKAKGITFESDQIEAFIDFQEDLKGIEAEAQKNREAELADHEQRKTDIEDRFNKQREKAIADQQRQEAKDRVELVKQEAKMRLDAQKQSEKDIVEEAADIAKAQQKAQEDQQKLEQDHRDKIAQINQRARLDLIQAASKLDARAAWNALQTQREQTKAENDTYARRKEELQIQLDAELQQIRQSREIQRIEAAAALELQIQEQRTAMEERHALQREELMYQFKQQDLQRQEELAKEQANHIQRMAQIDQRLGEERQRREQAFIEEFNRLAANENQKLAVQRMGQDQALKLLEAYWKNHNAIMQKNTAAPPKPSNYQNAPTSGGPQQGPASRPAPGTTPAPRPSPVIGPTGVSYFHTGGRALNTGLHILQKDEEVLQAQVAQQLRRFMGGSINQRDLVSVFANGSPHTVTHNKIEIERINNQYGPIGNRSNREVSGVTHDAILRALVDALGGGS